MQHMTESMPMQTAGYERLKDPRVTVMTNNAVRFVPASIPPVRDHIVWSLFNALYMNPFCLGFVAFYFSIKARDRKVEGDVEGAREYGSTARCLNIVALCLTLLFFVIVIVMLALGVAAIKESISSVMDHGN